MNRYIKGAATLGAAITLGAAFGACATNSGTPAMPSAGVGTVPRGATTQWAATINPEGGSGISGNAVVIGNMVQTRATVSLAGGTAGAVHPWHIHAGQCGGNGGIVGPPASYTPLTIGSDGAASASATVPVGLATGSSYYVNIHKSRTEMGTIVGCGNLAPLGGTAGM